MWAVFFCRQEVGKIQKLTAKQQRFADEYIISGNLTQSAIKAGYSKSSARQIASENMAKPYIKAYIDEKLQELQNEKIADQNEVLSYLTSVMRGEAKESKLMFVHDGTQEVVETPVDHRDRIRAAELLGKRYRTWTDKQEIDLNAQVSFIEDVPDDD